jgi:L-ascorbate metabolism protein UlaG (beta-lactamase superfamily)
MTTTLDWLGCATFRLTIGRTVIPLDAYVERGPSAEPTAPRAELLKMGYVERTPIFKGL